MIEVTTPTAGHLQVLHAPAASIRRGDQVALLTPDDTDGNGVAGAVTAVRTGSDPTVALVVANRVHFVPADHDVVIIRDPAQHGDRNGETHAGDQPRGTSRTRPGGGGRRWGTGERGMVTPAMPAPRGRHASDRTEVRRPRQERIARAAQRHPGLCPKYDHWFPCDEWFDHTVPVPCCSDCRLPPRKLAYTGPHPATA